MQKTIQEPIVPISTILGLDYETTSYDQRVKARYDYVKKKLEEDPDYEGWDYPEHLNYRNPNITSIYKDYLISTLGNVICLRLGEWVTIKPTIRKDGYFQVVFRHSAKVDCLLLHRVVGSTFIPIETGVDRFMLTVNHKYGIKSDNRVSEIEWMTLEDNAEHSVINNLGGFKRTNFFGSVFLGTYVLDDDFNGSQVIIRGTSGLKELGIDIRKLDKAIRYPDRSTLGCYWALVNHIENPEPIPQFILDKLINDHAYLDKRITPVLATPIDDPTKSFTMFGDREIKSNGFNASMVYQCLKGNSYQSKGHTFKYITRKEANKYPRGKP